MEEDWLLLAFLLLSSLLLLMMLALVMFLDLEPIHRRRLCCSCCCHHALNNVGFNEERRNKRNAPSTVDFNRSCASEFGQENNFCSEKFEGGTKSKVERLMSQFHETTLCRSDLKRHQATKFLSNSMNYEVTSSSQFSSWGSEVTWEQLWEVKRVDVRWHEFGWSTEL